MTWEWDAMQGIGRNPDGHAANRRCIADGKRPCGVCVLLPHVIAFDLAVLPHRVRPLPDALEVEVAGLTRAAMIEARATSARSPCADIGFPERFTCLSVRKRTVAHAEAYLELCPAR